MAAHCHACDAESDVQCISSNNENNQSRCQSIHDPTERRVSHPPKKRCILTCLQSVFFCRTIFYIRLTDFFHRMSLPNTPLGSTSAASRTPSFPVSQRSAELRISHYNIYYRRRHRMATSSWLASHHRINHLRPRNDQHSGTPYSTIFLIYAWRKAFQNGG
jgi:hypothetical protein